MRWLKIKIGNQNIMNLMNVSAYWQHVIQGVIILAAIILQVQTGKKQDR